MKCRATAQKLTAAMLAFSTFPLVAQRKGFDLSAGGGLADYFGSGTANRAKGMFEAAGLYNFAAHLGIGFEYAYSPLYSYTTTYGATNLYYSETGSDHLQHYGATVQVPFGISPHAEPFVAGHFGGLHESLNATVTTNNSTSNGSRTYNGGYVGAGVGSNFFVYRRFGVRPELRYEYLTESGSHLHELDLIGSVFYRFGGSR